MLIGYARVSKAAGSQSLDLQRAALWAEGIAMRKFPVETSTPATVRGIGLFIAPPVQLQGQGPIAQ